ISLFVPFRNTNSVHSFSIIDQIKSNMGQSAKWSCVSFSRKQTLHLSSVYTLFHLCFCMLSVGSRLFKHFILKIQSLLSFALLQLLPLTLSMFFHVTLQSILASSSSLFIVQPLMFSVAAHSVSRMLDISCVTKVLEGSSIRKFF